MAMDSISSPTSIGTYLPAHFRQSLAVGHDLGYVDEFREYANDVTEMFGKMGIKEIITVDPHTYDLLKNHYPDYVSGFDFRVTHYLDFLKNMNFRRVDAKVTMHEACHFSLREKPYNVPVEIVGTFSNLVLYGTEDLKEGISAFLQKRKPEFPGR